MRRVVVTGAAGFVGACLARRLVASGCDVALWHRPGSATWRIDALADDATLVSVDLEDDEAVGRAVVASRPQWVFHLAAHGGYSWQTSLERILSVNAIATARLLDACADVGVEAFVHAGSSSEYGFKGTAPAEDVVLEPNSAYAVGKAAASNYCRMVARRDGLLVRTLRLYSVYGPFEDPGRLVPRIVTLAQQGRLPPIADPSTARDFVFVDDVCDAFLRAASDRSGDLAGVYNVGTGRQLTLADVVEAAQRVFSISDTPSFGSLPSRGWDSSTWIANPSRIAEELGWSAPTSFDDGLRATARWLDTVPVDVLARYEGVSS